MGGFSWQSFPPSRLRESVAFLRGFPRPIGGESYLLLGKGHQRILKVEHPAPLSTLRGFARCVWLRGPRLRLGPLRCPRRTRRGTACCASPGATAPRALPRRAGSWRSGCFRSSARDEDDGTKSRGRVLRGILRFVFSWVLLGNGPVDFNSFFRISRLSSRQTHTS